MGVEDMPRGMATAAAAVNPPGRRPALTARTFGRLVNSARRPRLFWNRTADIAEPRLVFAVTGIRPVTGPVAAN
jgi:hypothetical protein